MVVGGQGLEVSGVRLDGLGLGSAGFRVYDVLPASKDCKNCSDAESFGFCGLVICQDFEFSYCGRGQEMLVYHSSLRCVAGFPWVSSVL